MGWRSAQEALRTCHVCTQVSPVEKDSIYSFLCLLQCALSAKPTPSLQCGLGMMLVLGRAMTNELGTGDFRSFEKAWPNSAWERCSTPSGSILTRRECQLPTQSLLLFLTKRTHIYLVMCPALKKIIKNKKTQTTNGSFPSRHDLHLGVAMWLSSAQRLKMNWYLGLPGGHVPSVRLLPFLLSCCLESRHNNWNSSSHLRPWGNLENWSEALL